jgi:hypothetical protein
MCSRDQFPQEERKTKKLWLVRKDEAAVTPVIATILLVAITVLLVSTLYVMVTSLLPGSAAGENTIFMEMSDNQDGNWTLIVSQMSNPGIPVNSVKLTIYDQSAVIKLNRVALSALTMSNWTSYRAVYHGRPGAGLTVGDSISVFKNAVAEHSNAQKWWGYWSGNSYSMTYGSVLLVTGKL